VSAWKRQAVESLSAFFDGMARPQAPESELFEQIGRLKMELEWLKKSTELDQRRELIGRKCKLSICKQCELFGVGRSSSCANVGVAKSRGPAQGYGLPLDAPKTGAKRLDLLAGPPEVLQ
jgi:hypothetical protein